MNSDRGVCFNCVLSRKKAKSATPWQKQHNMNWFSCEPSFMPAGPPGPFFFLMDAASILNHDLKGKKRKHFTNRFGKVLNFPSRVSVFVPPPLIHDVFIRAHLLQVHGGLKHIPASVPPFTSVLRLDSVNSSQSSINLRTSSSWDERSNIFCIE